jgi:dihydrofolate synthase / folylpolyglutamate synthase
VTLDELTPWLFTRVSGGVRWGLDRTRGLLAGVGDPHRRFRSIHIGGTNGKGSVAALCDAALRARGDIRVGLYTSPHLVSFEERIRIDGRNVPAGALAEAATRLRSAIERTDATFFEATTAMAFLVLAEAGVDVVVAEVGLGGRLDATNVLDPLVTCVTSVGLDHQEYLGDTLEDIAREKAGIFKSGVPAITGVRQPELVEILRDRAVEVGAPFVQLDDVAAIQEVRLDRRATEFLLRSDYWGDRRVSLPLPGTHQARNAALAAELLAFLPSDLRPAWAAIRAGFDSVRWPGRMQVVEIRGTTWLFDIAHNEEGVAALLRSLPDLSLRPPLVGVIGILGDKDWAAMLPRLLDATDAAILTVPDSAPPARRWDPAEAARTIGHVTRVRPTVIASLSAALDRATTLAPHGTVLVTGSIHTVGDAMRLLEVPSD